MSPEAQCKAHLLNTLPNYQYCPSHYLGYLLPTYQALLSRTNEPQKGLSEKGCHAIYYGKPNIRLGWA